MIPVLILGAVLLLYLYEQKKVEALAAQGTQGAIPARTVAGTSLGSATVGGVASTVPITHPATLAPAPSLSSPSTQLIGSGVAVGASGGTSIAVASGALAAGGAVAIAIPVVGAAFAIVFGALMAAHEKRKAQAVNENRAVANAVPGWDSAMSQVVAAYNKGGLTLADVQKFLNVPQNNDPTLPSAQGIMWQNYWQEVGPVVQPGRNACHSGADVQPSTQSWCSGSYGAGCCVAYDDLKNASVYALQAVAQAEAHPGQAFTSKQFPMVYASKYGGVNRPGYSVTFRKPVTIGL